jgi:outer membrane receptor protein involved in Fe transport
MAVTFAGGNSELKPEQSKSTSLGFIYSPESMDPFRVSLDYTRIEKKDEITTISFQEIINMEELFPGRVTRGDRNSGDPADWAGQITAIDASAVNISESNVEAIDLQFDKEWWTGKWGKFHVYGVVSYQSSLDRKLLPQSDIQNRVGYSDGVLRWRGNFGGNWTKGPLRVSVNTSYYDSYKVFSSYDDPLSAEYTIPSQSYTDVSMSYKFQTGWLADSSLNFGVRNIFNQKPPTVATVDTRGGYSTYGDPRLSTYVLSFEHNF